MSGVLVRPDVSILDGRGCGQGIGVYIIFKNEWLIRGDRNPRRVMLPGGVVEVQRVLLDGGRKLGGQLGSSGSLGYLGMPSRSTCSTYS